MQHMKKKLLIFIFLITMINLSAQECEYTEYYPLVDSAFKNYSEENYKEAEKNLKLAFNKTDFPLGKDLNLALIVAQKRDDSEWTEKISISLAKGGVPLRYFVKFKNFKWYKKFLIDFEDYSRYYAENFKPELREKIISLLKQDTDFNSKYHQWRAREIEISLQELIDGATKIQTEFKLLTYKYGFPNERIMGYNYVYRKHNIERYPTDVLMIHIYQRGTLIFKEDIPNIVCKGGLVPSSGITLKEIRGFGNSDGIEQEMKIRYEKYRGK
jgi:hypothetical protein